MPLFCLVYTSLATRKLSDDDLKQILDVSRPKNQALNITGMLLYLDPFFVQVLEGEEQIVMEKFNRISKDPTHHKVSLIYKKPISQRTFSNWTMGFNKIGHEPVESVENLEALYQSEVFKQQPKDIAELLEMFKKETLF